ncbi:MAG: hypothetical protein HYW86_00210 [Candidatus Roizmanbacteria bacterium]|nr:MAG: hypothetical protein HYW86_00210 [Candidatus Roizmanbacteria bacterium]
MVQTYKSHLLSKQQLTHNVYLFRFGLDEPNELIFTPGQYMILFVPQSEDEPASPGLQRGEPICRLYSIASLASPNSALAGEGGTNSFELLIEIIPNGLASEFLLKLDSATEVTFQGPAGQFTLAQNNKDKVFMVTGTGIAPVRSILLTALTNSQPTTHNSSPITNYQLLWGLPTFKDVYFLEEFKQLAAVHSNFTFTICLSRETKLSSIPEEDRQFFKLGHVNDNIQLDLTNTDYYLCGSPKVIESLKSYLAANNVEPNSIIFEKF